MPSRTPTVFHSKRVKNNQPTHVVTGVYRLNARTGLLLCAGTVYNASNGSNASNASNASSGSNGSSGSNASNGDLQQKVQTWDRKAHMERAFERFNTAPHKIQFDKNLKLSEDHVMAYYQFRRLESFIRKIFSKYGVLSGKTPIANLPEVRALIVEMQDTIFSQTMTQAEEEKERLYNLAKNHENSSNSDLDDVVTNDSSIDNKPMKFGKKVLTMADKEAIQMFQRMMKLSEKLRVESVEDVEEDEDQEDDQEGPEDQGSLLTHLFDAFSWFVMFSFMAVFMAYLTNVLSEEQIWHAWMVIMQSIRRNVQQVQNNSSF